MGHRVAIVACLLTAAGCQGRELLSRVDALVPAEMVVSCNDFVPGLSGGLASWQSVAGCGSGASSGTAGGVKWIGRNVRGGLVHVECQVNYVEQGYGYNLVANSLVSYELTSRTRAGVGVPYLWKWMDDPHKLGVDLANKGAGDITLFGSHRFGATGALSSTLAVGVPTGSHDVAYKMDVLWQDRQLGLGKPTATLTVDHVGDEIWGATVIGGNAAWRGGKNDLGSYRAPSASGWAYASYLLGPFAPAAGLSVTGYFGNDLDRGSEQALPTASVAANLSLEWSTDWLALLVGASFPYDLAVGSDAVKSHNRVGAWTVAFGVAFAAF